MDNSSDIKGGNDDKPYKKGPLSEGSDESAPLRKRASRSTSTPEGAESGARVRKTRTVKPKIGDKYDSHDSEGGLRSRRPNKALTERSDDSERPARPRAPREGVEKRPYTKREGSGDRAPRGGDRSDKPSFERKPSYPKRDRDSSGDGEERPRKSGPYVKREGSGERSGGYNRSDKDSKSDRPSSFRKREDDGDKKPFRKREDDGDRKPFKKREDDGDRKPYSKRAGDGDRKPFKKREDDGDRKPFKRREDGDSPRSFNKGDDGDRPKRSAPFKRSEGSGDRPYGKSENNDRAPRKSPYKRSYEDDAADKPYAKKADGDRPSFRKNDGGPRPPRTFNKDRELSSERDREAKPFKKPFEKNGGEGSYKKFESAGKPKRVHIHKPKAQEDDDDDFEDEGKKPRKTSAKSKDKEDEAEDDKPEQMPLNKYVAHCGVSGRREAAEIIKKGVIKVNGEVILEPGFKVPEDALVTMNDERLTVTKGLVYILLNKPKDYITTTSDPQGRKTVMQLLEGAEGGRLFPVGRLDRNTSGLLLITNDGELTQKLSHPGFNIKKVYKVEVDKPVTKADFDKILEGVELEDGRAHVDSLAYLDTKKELGIEIHSGKNRVVRRIFESLGYVVEKLDRVMYAGLTKKNLPRAKWRYLDQKEIMYLKHFNSK